MVVDADLQVWLDTQATAAQIVIVPFVKSTRDMHIQFRMDVVRKRDGSTSHVSQQGMVATAGTTPTALARVVLGGQTGGECRVELSLREGERSVGTYYFNCADS